jgi:hypothetical protein
MLHTDLAPVVTTPFPCREGGAFKPLPASLRGWGGVRSGSDFTNRIINSPSNSKSRINLRSCTILNKRQSLDILVPRLNLGTRVCGLLPPVYGNWCKISNKSQILHHSQQEAEPRYSRLFSFPGSTWERGFVGCCLRFMATGARSQINPTKKAFSPLK